MEVQMALRTPLIEKPNSPVLSMAMALGLDLVMVVSGWWLHFICLG
jgi:hypothetical protein